MRPYLWWGWGASLALGGSSLRWWPGEIYPSKQMREQFPKKPLPLCCIQSSLGERWRPREAHRPSCRELLARRPCWGREPGTPHGRGARLLRVPQLTGLVTTNSPLVFPCVGDHVGAPPLPRDRKSGKLSRLRPAWVLCSPRKQRPGKTVRTDPSRRTPRARALGNSSRLCDGAT